VRGSSSSDRCVPRHRGPHPAGDSRSAAGGSAPVNALAADFRQSRPAISKHLRVLRRARLVVEERAGRERLYELQPRPLQQVAGWIEGYRSFWLTSLGNLKRYLEEK
jgi:DNA-binding transcriptional ArsR family regulator